MPYKCNEISDQIFLDLALLVTNVQSTLDTSNFNRLCKICRVISSSR